MKIMKKIILICILSITFLSFFLIPKTYAQEWTYDGANTERIPSHSVYPSEWYVYQMSDFTDILFMMQITNGNISDPGPGNGFCVWANVYYKNITSDELIPGGNTYLSYWNESIGYIGSGSVIPIENDGKVSERILSNASDYWEYNQLGSFTFEHNQIYFNIYSIAFWNDTYNKAYMHLNYTEDGILSAYKSEIIPFGNLTIYSQPAQLPPDFSFTTETGELTSDSTDLKLNITITDADNNNDNVTDTDYLYRILNGSTWTDWAIPPTQLDWDLGPVATGEYPITIEIKNMYGVTQKEISIQYTAPESTSDGGVISGYPVLLSGIIGMLGIFLFIYKNRKKI